MKLYIVVAMLLCSSLRAEPYVEKTDIAAWISKYGQRATLGIGLASVVLNTELARGKCEHPLKYTNGHLSSKDVKNLGGYVARMYYALLSNSFYKSWVSQPRPVPGRQNKFFDTPADIDPKQDRSGAAFHSFPSQHAVKYFFGAATVHREFGMKVAAPFYLFSAAATSVRLFHDNHYLHDVIAGAIFGIKMAFANDLMSVIPTPTSDGGVISYTVKF